MEDEMARYVAWIWKIRILLGKPEARIKKNTTKI
jgi:hypothetical protein